MYTRLAAYALVAALTGAASAGDLNPSIHAETSVKPVLNVPSPTLTLTQRCAKASVLIKNHQCGSISCDRALGMALQAGCRINHWGHTPKYD
jgi:hypothetical protein